MALFSLTDIKIKEQKVRKSLSGNRFDSDTVRFPLDIGDVDKGHYVVFNIFVSQFISKNYNCAPTADSLPQNRSGVTLGGAIDTIGDVAGGFLDGKTTNQIKTFTETTLKKIQTGELGKQTVQVAGQFSNQVRNFEMGYLPGARIANKVSQIKDTVVLYMPNTLNYSQQQSYREISRNDMATNIVVGAELLKTPSIENILPFLSGTFKAAEVLGGLTGSPGTISAIFARNLGIENPRAELLYSRPQFRNFSFEFMLYPRSEKEALEVQKIIRKFNHHSVPSLKSGTAGQFLVPPAEFGISFYYNGMENPNIPKIKQCVLESINADYAPNGFHAYESASDVYPALGGTGMPIAIRLTMNFRELELLTKTDYPDKDYGSRDME